MLRATAALGVLALVTAGCAQGAPAEPAPTSTTTSTPTASPGHDGRLLGRGTVIDDGSGPVLCLGVVLQSLPPQCDGGVALVDWRWPERGVERQAGTTWGEFSVVGTYDGRRLRVEKTVAPTSRPGSGRESFDTPCPEPPGGWQVPDPARATQEDQDRAFRLAERRTGYADAWVEELSTPGDPATTVLNFSFTTDLAGAERALRAVWGGPLCVSKGERTHAELAAIHSALRKTPGLLLSGFGFGHVRLTVIHDDGSLQRESDQRYGAGLVLVNSALRPYVE